MDHHFYLPSTEPLPAPPAPGPLIVGFWTRAKAYFVDGLIISLVTGVLANLAEGFSAWPATGWVVAAISWAFGPAYYIWAYSTSGQTPGKKWAHIKVVSVDGSPLNWRKGVLRVIGYALGDFCFFLGYLWAALDADKQAWHDKIARTRVVPASATEEQVRVAFNQMQLRERSGRWKWAAGACVAAELAVAACIVGVFITQPKPQLHDAEWDQFENALFARVNPDAAIPEFNTSRSYDVESGQAAHVWLEMKLTYKADCAAGSTNDWCYRLANELVQIVFDNYPHINEIDGIHVVMTRQTDLGVVTFESTPVDETLTISEWQQRLAGAGP